MESKIRVRSSAISWTLTERDEVVILDLRTSHYLSLNSSAARLWQRMADGVARSDLVEDLTEIYGLSPVAAERDVDAFVAALIDLDLIDSESSASQRD